MSRVKEGIATAVSSIKKCSLCTQYKAKNNACFGKAHPQMIRTVRVHDGEQLGMVNTRGVMSLYGHYYFRLKPGSPIFVWEEGKIVTMSPDDASKALTVALAPGTVLERSLCLKQAITWLHEPNEPLLEYVVPEMSKPRLLPKGEVRIDRAEDCEESLEREARTESVNEECEYEVTAKREYEEPKRKKSRRRSSRSQGGNPSASDDLNAASSRIGGGETGPGEDRGSSEVAADEPPDISSLPTKGEVQRRLAEKLKACDEREVQLKAVINKANAELEKNNESRKAAVAGSNAQILAIINRREAYAAYCEKLAAKARAQNLADRESLDSNLSAHQSTARDSRQQIAAHEGNQASESDTSTDIPKHAEVTPHAAATTMAGPRTGSSAPSQGAVYGIAGGSIPASQASPLVTSTAISPKVMMPEPVGNRPAPDKEGHANTLAEPPAVANPEAQPVAPQAGHRRGMQADQAASCQAPSSSTVGNRSRDLFYVGSDPGPADNAEGGSRVTPASVMVAESTAAKATSSSAGVGFSSWIPARSRSPNHANGHDVLNTIARTSEASELPRTPVQPANELAGPADAPPQGATICPARQKKLPYHPAGRQGTTAGTANGTSGPDERSPQTALTLRVEEPLSMALSQPVTRPPPSPPALGITQSDQEKMEIDVEE